MTDTERGMFKQYDIRVKSSNLSQNSKVRLCKAVAAYYKDFLNVDRVVICRDARLYAPDLVEELIAWFRREGVSVLVNPLPISTCQFYYSCMQNRTSGGIMVTASHNPGEYIGLKLIGPELYTIAFDQGPEGGIKKIMQLYQSNSFCFSDSFTSKVTVINYMDSYIAYCMKLAGVKENGLKGLKVLFEFLNGSAGTEVALAFQKAGAEIELRDIVPNGFFPKGDPNPVIETSIAPARAAMKEGNFNLGFCFDGDGDRLDLMGPDGRQIIPGLNMSIIVKELKKIFGPDFNNFYSDLRSMPVSLLEMAKTGVKTHLIRNGHSFIKGKLRNNADKGYFGAVEESAHYYLNFPFDIEDKSKGFAAVEASLFFALLTARCYLENPSEYSRIIKLQDSVYREREWSVCFGNSQRKINDLIKEIEKRLVSMGAEVINKMDDKDSLDASLIRFNLPSKFDLSSSLDGVVWAQAAVRISRSEDSLCRFEVASNSKEKCKLIKEEIVRITDSFV